MAGTLPDLREMKAVYQRISRSGRKDWASEDGLRDW